MGLTNTGQGKAIKGFGEIALRVNDLDTMQKFYEQVVGLEVLNRSDDAVFLKVAEGYGGHTQVLVLFDRSKQSDYSGIDARKSTVDHIAFEIDLADFEAEKRRLEGAGIPLTTAEHAWVHWRSLYVRDPEGNEVEFVCYDKKV